MAEFIGTQSAIDLQKRLRDRQADIAASADLCNGGRLLHFLEPEATGWPRIREVAETDRILGFPAMPKDTPTRRIAAELGPDWTAPAWLCLLGHDDQVVSACETIAKSISLPDDWHVVFHERPTEDEIEVVQTLNAATGVSPYPAYYMRSEAVPVLTACIKDGTGVLRATASVADRYHPDSRLAGHVFAGMVSVDKAERGRGLGKLINALALMESHRRFGWRVATEQVAPDNSASLAMIKACGLDHRQGLWSVAAMATGASLTR